MDILKKLEDSLFSESLNLDRNSKKQLIKCLQQVQDLANVEGSLNVLSDIANNTSFIFTGKVGSYFGLQQAENLTINSIWEDDIYNRIHPDDILERHLLELEFTNFVKQEPLQNRLNYETNSKIRALNNNREYNYIKHRTKFLKLDNNGTPWLVLCTYEFLFDAAPQLGIDGIIVNKNTGEKIIANQYKHCSNLLSKRESDVLLQVDKGLLSKEIADLLNISINTVNRHRQNILQKLNVSNSIEAVRVARALGILS